MHVCWCEQQQQPALPGTRASLRINFSRPARCSSAWRDSCVSPWCGCAPRGRGAGGTHMETQPVQRRHAPRRDRVVPLNPTLLTPRRNTPITQPHCPRTSLTEHHSQHHRRSLRSTAHTHAHTDTRRHTGHSWLRVHRSAKHLPACADNQQQQPQRIVPSPAREWRARGTDGQLRGG